MKSKQSRADLFFAISYPVMFLVFFGARYSIKICNGSAFGGKIESGLFFVIDESSKYWKVSAFSWIMNLCLFVLTCIFVAIAGIGFFYFGIKYFYVPLFRKIRALKIGNRLY